ncbi:Nop14-like protein [Piedraia hortae CBS 480.64]|uniref:Nop14-like protein n=1 Tax=Piedraia hortae CBS 480.64 TaxID=1314780 RepID=A0A6A7BTA6_9PEZI|nr:Nop14-like protein [Piedraia hortae CBS 480.64]
MAHSQLKQLKSSLREKGVIGQKNKKKGKKSGRTTLQDPNPFEVRSRPPKFESFSSRNDAAVHRPGVSRSAGEDLRRAQLLPELRRKGKAGAVFDRRLGEGEIRLSAKEKDARRYAREKRGKGVFSLEESEGEEGGLLAMSFGFAQEQEEESDDEGELLARKRPAEEVLEEQERKKSKKEVMNEVIAKSKFYKYERQKAKEEEEELREKLDRDLEEVMQLLQKVPKGEKEEEKKKEKEKERNGSMAVNPERQKLLDGMDRAEADKEYSAKMRQMAQGARAQPADRTKTVEELQSEEAERVKTLQEKRERRMRGNVSDESGDEVEDDEADEAAQFGLNRPTKPIHEDEDEFDLDEDLIASGSDISDVELTDDESAAEEADEFEEKTASYAGSCPRSHAELLAIVQYMSPEELPALVQRIRAKYQPSLAAANRELLGELAVALVDHVAYMAVHKQPLAVIEQLIRHLHSLSRTYSTEIARAFRGHLQKWAEREDGHPNAGDFAMLTAIGSIYPTSDHFHPVVTPAMTLIAKWLGLNGPETKKQQTIGAFLVAQGMSYQKLSKRYIPEAVRFTLRTLELQPSMDELTPHLANLMTMAKCWSESCAFIEIFTPFLAPLTRLPDASHERQQLEILLQQARLSRCPLELHHHRPLPIRTAVPKFEEGFNPDKHYDPDRERADAKRLQKEYKRERKGALRELKKDANFIARVQLAEKRKKDEEYHSKQRKLLAEIQEESGRQKNEYERERERQKRKQKR